MSFNINDLYNEVKNIEREWGSAEHTSRAEYVAIAIGAIATSVLPLPTSPVGSVSNHYILQHESVVKNLFSQLNELYVFNISLSIKIARQVYLARYRRVYDVQLIISELSLLMPEHVSRMPDEVTKVFSQLSENQKHTFSEGLVHIVGGLLGTVSI